MEEESVGRKGISIHSYVAHTFPGGIQGPGRGVTAHQRAPPEKATGPARLAHPGFGLEHPGNGPKTGKSLNFTYHKKPGVPYFFFLYFFLKWGYFFFFVG